MGHKVKLADPAKIKAIWGSTVKTDDRDSEMLARLANADMKLLNEVHLKDTEVQVHASVLKARDRLVMSRTQLVLFTRSQFKQVGVDIPTCSTASFAKTIKPIVPKELKIVLQSILKTISFLTEEIKKYDKKISKLCKKYKETKKLQQIDGVGPLTSLGFCLAVGNKTRFKKNRSIGAYFGLVPKCDQSGETNKQLKITKAGNSNIRRLLINCAQYILGVHGKDSDLRRFGERIINHSKSKERKRKAVVAVSRKLSVLLLKLYKTDEVYIPLKNSLKKAA
jgi:transposase